MSDFLNAFGDSQWETAVEIGGSEWVRLIFTRETYEAFFRMVAEAPAELLSKDPVMGLHAEVRGRFSVGTSTFSLPRGQERIDKAIESGRSKLLLEQSILGMMSRRVTRQPIEGVSIAAAARPLLKAATTTRFSPAVPLAAYWHLQAAQVSLQAGDFLQAAEDLDSAWSLREYDTTGYVAPSAAPYQALLATLNCDAPATTMWREVCDSLTITAENYIEAEVMSRPLRLAELFLSLGNDNPSESDNLAAVLEPQLPFDDLWPLTLLALARHQIMRGRSADAERVAAATMRLNGSANSVDSLQFIATQCVRAELALAAGQSHAAARHLAHTNTARLPPLLATTQSRIAAHLETSTATRLTPSEIRVLEALQQPVALPHVAKALNISINTLKTHLRSLYEKLESSSRKEALERGVQLGLITTPGREPVAAPAIPQTRLPSE